MKLRVGLVGLGESWEQRHRPALRALGDRFEVRAICEQVSHRARQAAAEFEASAVDGFRALADREDIDAVLMLSDQWFGLLPILAACDSGKAVYCSVDVALEPEQAEHIRRRVEESGIAFMAEFPRRQAPATLRLKELIATELGEPRLLFCHARSPRNHGPQNGDPRCRKENASRHSARDLIELVDWCRYVVGSDPTAVTGLMHGESGEPAEEDYQMMSLDFSPPGHPGTGAVAQISRGRYIPARWQEAVTYRPLAALQVSCQRGIAFVDLPSTLVWFDDAGRHQESLESERPVGEQLLAQFHRSVTSLLRNTSDLQDACLAQSIVLAARRSHQEGRRIELPKQ